MPNFNDCIIELISRYKMSASFYNSASLSNTSKANATHNYYYYMFIIFIWICAQNFPSKMEFWFIFLFKIELFGLNKYINPKEKRSSTTFKLSRNKNYNINLLTIAPFNNVTNLWVNFIHCQIGSIELSFLQLWFQKSYHDYDTKDRSRCSCSRD
jgi:hypothetical protein